MEALFSEFYGKIVGGGFILPLQARNTLNRLKDET